MNAIRTAVRGIISEAERCVNTARPLTHSLDLGEEGIAVKATRTCPRCSIVHAGSEPLCDACRVRRWVERHPDPRICEVEGCGKILAATSTRKVCEMHYRRMRLYGSYDAPPRRRPQSDTACSVDGCSKAAKTRGMCGMHAERVRSNGDPNVVRIVFGDAERRFWSHVDKDSAAPCWLWTGWVNENGYGQFVDNNQRFAAHRWSHIRYVGPIPDGYEVDHVYARGCRYRNCVNPAHLEAVTPEENQRRIPAERRANQWTGGKR